MASLAPSLPFDPESVTLSEEAEYACNLRFDINEYQLAELFACGTWWVLPLARWASGTELVGVRVVPGVPLTSCPVVNVKRFEVQTVASSLSALVPSRIVREAFHQPTWEKLRALDDGVWLELSRLNAALGGTTDLSVIRAALADNELRSNAAKNDVRTDADLLCLGDPAPETRRFREYVTAAIVSNVAPTPIPSVGCWNAFAAGVSFVTNTHWSANRECDALAAAWSLACCPVGLDCFQQITPSQLSVPYGASPDGLPRQIAEYLIKHQADVPAEWQHDPLWPALRATANGDRNGAALAYMDAATLLKEGGAPERAFYALTSASYWMWVSTQQPFPQLMHGAVLLAGEARWLEALEALDAVATRTRDALAAL